MIKVIWKYDWKYELKHKGIQKIEMPIDAEILTVQMQMDCLVLWALVNSENKTEERTFEIFGTGIHISKDIPRKYIGTFQTQGGYLVFHVFEQNPKP